MLVTVDKEDFVVSVKHEPSDAMVESAMREIERSDMPKLETRICKGPWHYKAGKGTPLPIADFSGTNKTCNSCLDRNNKFRTPRETQPLSLRDIDNGMDSAVHKWKVLVLQPTEVVVYAKSYVEIPAEVQGEVLRVERLD